MKKKNVMKVAGTILVASLALTACGRKNNNNNANNQSQAQTEQSSSTEEQSQGTGNGTGTMEDYQTLLSAGNNDEDIYGFFDENMGNFEQGDVDTMMSGFFGRFDDIGQVDFNRLSVHSDAMSPEMKDFVELMMTEQGSPSITEEGIQLTLIDLLDRCKIYEDFLQRYPNGQNYQYAYDQYERMLTNAISGGYDGESTSTHYYMDTENEGQIDPLAIDAYKTFIESNPDSITARVVSDYVTEMSQNKNQINDTANTYYQGLGEKIKGHFNS